MLIRRTLIFVKRKYTESIIQVVLLFLLFSFFFSGVVMYHSTAMYRDQALADIGASLQVSHLPELDEALLDGTDPQIITTIEKLPHVMSVDVATPSLSGPCIPVGLETVKTHTGYDPERQPSSIFSEEEERTQMNCVNISGCSAISLRDQFRKKLSVITEGTFPTQDVPGVLVSRSFAQLNDLNINDNIKLKYLYSDDQESAIEATIIGIYDTSLRFEVLKDNDMGTAVYMASPYNAVFVDFDTASRILGRENTIHNFKVYVDSPRYLDDVQNELLSLSLDWSKYQIYNETLSYYSEYASQIDTVFSNSLRLIILTSTIGIILFIVVYSIWNKQRIRDIGIFEALGENKFKILAQYMLEMLFLSAVATVISIPAAFILISLLSQTMAPELISANAGNLIIPYDTGEFDINTVFSVSFDLRSVLLLVAFALLIISITGIALLLLMKKSRLQEMLKNGG